MLYGLYLSAQGVQAQSTRLDVLSNNLANAGTAGFKRDLAIFQSHRPYDVENGGVSNAPSNQSALSGGLSTASVLTDYSNGPVVRTGGALDVALSGPGFFQVSDGSQQFLTRQGQFALNASGDLVIQNSGLRVLSNTNTPINVPSEAVRVEIGNDGTLSSVGADGARTQIARLGLVKTKPDQQLEKVGSSLFKPPASLAPAGNDLSLEQGFVEQSTVAPVNEMIDMIQAARMVEANVNMMKFQDDALDRLLQAATPH
jgi:flagellar basal-body rod protein FlgF